MKRLLLLVATIGCNSVLGIPERELAVDDDTGVAIDSTVESDIDTGTPPDSSMVETDPVDTDMSESMAMDSTVDTSAPPDSEIVDTLKPDTKPDTFVPDTSMPDTSMPDTLVPDTAMPDTSVTDTGTDAATCGVGGKPCCGAVPASCDKGAVCNQTTGMCAAVAGACTRASDCPGSACGGPNSCSGNVCYSCTPVFGTKAFGVACATGGDCASGVCDGFRGVCSAACSNGITVDADCKSFGSNVVCSELTFGSGATSGKVGFCAQGCGRDADCTGGKTCGISSNNDADRVDLTCSPPGSAAYGAACSSNCVGGGCITFGATTQCSPTCVTAADCTAMATWKNCVTVGFSRPKSGGLQAVKVCGP